MLLWFCILSYFRLPCYHWSWIDSSL